MGQQQVMVADPGPMQLVVATKKHGTKIETMLPWARKYFILAIALAEQKKGMPVQTPDVIAELQFFTTFPKSYGVAYVFTL